MRGGIGEDVMDGGAGSDSDGGDIYLVDDLSDEVIEVLGATGGIDTVRSTVTFTLAANVENLQLLGNAPIDATGNAQANVLTGNNAANALIGGLGNNTLTGGVGPDIFVFNTAPGAQNVDHLTDFVVGRDVIQMDSAVFTGLALGRPNGGVFVNGPTALDANDRLIYDISTGNLRYDTDGTGASASVIVAILDNQAALTNASFFVI